MNKPVYLGQAILDLSKIVMYEFHYDHTIPKYSDKLQLLYLDTDSLIYHIRTENFYKDIALDVEARFDTSAYAKDDNRTLPIGKNKEVIGLMKDELGGKIITEFVGFRAKLYAYKVFEDRHVKRCKGIKKAVVQNTITFGNYKECLFSGKTVYRDLILFRNKKHIVYTEKSCKISLNRDDDKRLVQADGISTLARGFCE